MMTLAQYVLLQACLLWAEDDQENRESTLSKFHSNWEHPYEQIRTL